MASVCDVNQTQCELTRPSDLTGREHSMVLNTTADKVQKWYGAHDELPYIQDFFPELNQDEREFIMTGSTREEWDQIFGEE